MMQRRLMAVEDRVDHKRGIGTVRLTWQTGRTVPTMREIETTTGRHTHAGMPEQVYETEEHHYALTEAGAKERALLLQKYSVELYGG